MVAQEVKRSGWRVATRKGHILESRCTREAPCTGEDATDSLCDHCRFDRNFDMPLPEELYAQNELVLQHQASGATIKFSAEDALKGVDQEHDLVKVDYSGEWQAARAKTHQEKLSNVKPYDWTYTTDYKGTVDPRFEVTETDERIDLEALKVREQILLYESLFLYADDFGDNGVVHMNVRVRVMPSGVFVLQRLYVRVDRVLVRVHDTRLYHRFEAGYAIREYLERECTFADFEKSLGPAATSILYQTDEVDRVLGNFKTIVERVERIQAPAS